MLDRQPEEVAVDRHSHQTQARDQRLPVVQNYDDVIAAAVSETLVAMQLAKCCEILLEGLAKLSPAVQIRMRWQDSTRVEEEDTPGNHVAC